MDEAVRSVPLQRLRPPVLQPGKEVDGSCAHILPRPSSTGAARTRRVPPRRLPPMRAPAQLPGKKVEVVGPPGHATRSEPTCKDTEAKIVRWIRGDKLDFRGRVFKATDQRTGKTFVVKKISAHGVDQKDLRSSLQLLCSMQHPNLVALLGFDCMEREIHLYQEYMPGGSLKQMLESRGPLDEASAANVTAQVLEGLHYLHSHSPAMLHEDLRASNIFMGLDSCWKISNLRCLRGKADVECNIVGNSTVACLAPEVLEDSSRPDGKTDVWSLGCVVIEMATAKIPFDAPNLFRMVTKIMNSDHRPLPDHASESCRDFVRACLQREKSSRPAAADLLLHDFLPPAQVVQLNLSGIEADGASISGTSLGGNPLATVAASWDKTVSWLRTQLAGACKCRVQMVLPDGSVLSAIDDSKALHDALKDAC